MTYTPYYLLNILGNLFFTYYIKEMRILFFFVAYALVIKFLGGFFGVERVLLLQKKIIRNITV